MAKSRKHHVIFLIVFMWSEAHSDKVAPVPESKVHTSQSIPQRSEKNGIASVVCDSFPCLNGGTCVVTGTDTYKCKCAPYYIGEQCMTEPLTNVALSTCGATCDESSVLGPEYNCYTCIDASPRGWYEGEISWASDYERIGAWMNINFTDYFRIHSASIFDRCQIDRSLSTIFLETSDYKSQELGLMCLGTDGCDDKFVQVFDLVPTITRFLHIEVAGVCDPASTDYIGFHYVGVHANDVPLMNAASIYVGATCTASSEYQLEDASCRNAIDEVDAPGPGNEWVSDGQGAGAWIQVNLNRTSTVMAVGFLQRCSQASQNNFIMLEFSDDSTQEIELECFTTGLDPLDCDGQYWQQFDLNPYVVTSYVRVTITAVCTAENNGFREIRVFSLREEGNY